MSRPNRSPLKSLAAKTKSTACWKYSVPTVSWKWFAPVLLLCDAAPSPPPFTRQRRRHTLPPPVKTFRILCSQVPGSQTALLYRKDNIMSKMYHENSADVALIRAKKVAIIGYGSPGHAHSPY